MSVATPLLQVRALRKSFCRAGAAGILIWRSRRVRSMHLSAATARENPRWRASSRGLLDRDDGEITLGGQPLRARSRREAQTAGVTLMLQELKRTAHAEHRGKHFSPSTAAAVGLRGPETVSARDDTARAGTRRVGSPAAPTRLPPCWAWDSSNRWRWQPRCRKSAGC